MGIFNCEKTLHAAVTSIQTQTYSEWELIMCDDGSTDATYQVASDLALSDTRIKILRNSVNIGLAPTLDKCAAHAQGEFFGRMDGDDISQPERLSKLVAALDDNPWAAVVSSWMSCFDTDGTWGLIKTPSHPDRNDHLHGSPYCHAPCMIRRSAFEAVGGYGNSPWIHRVEDRNLWFKLEKAGLRGLNLQESLYLMRDDRDAAGRRTFRARFNGFIVRWRGIGWLGFPFWMRFLAFRPLIIWLIPSFIYRWLRRKRYSVS